MTNNFLKRSQQPAFNSGYSNLIDKSRIFRFSRVIKKTISSISLTEDIIWYDFYPRPIAHLLPLHPLFPPPPPSPHTHTTHTHTHTHVELLCFKFCVKDFNSSDFPDHIVDLVYILYDDRYQSEVLSSNKVKVMSLELMWQLTTWLVWW